MTYYYSITTRGFYRSDIHEGRVPADAVQLTADEYAALVAGHAGGKDVTEGEGGALILTDKKGPAVNQTAAKTARDAAIAAPITLEGTTAAYQVGGASHVNIMVAVRRAESAGYTGAEVRKWRLADNTWRDTTLDDLRQLIRQYDERFEAVWGQFSEWDAGDRSEPFEVSL